MAAPHFRLITKVSTTITLCVTALTALAGCQNQQYVQDLPTPNFNGPAIIAPAPAPAPEPPSPVTLNAQPTPSAKTSTAAAWGAVPKSWIPNATARPWKWIVIHHSATPSGSAAVFDKM